MISLEFLLASLLVALIPGTGVIYTLSIALSKGRISSFYAAVGCTLGIIPHILMTLISINLFVSFNDNILIILKYLGFIYLLYLAYGLYNSEDEFSFSINTVINKSILLKGFLINILNPKLTIFLVAYFPQFLSTNTSTITYEILEGSFVFMLLTLIVFFIYGVFASYLRNQLFSNKLKGIFIQKLFAICFVIIAISLII